MTQRTKRQNKSLHKFCDQMANKLNDAGHDQKAVFEHIKKLDVPNTKESIKEIFKAVARTMYQFNSTTELSTKQIQEVYEAVNRGFAMTLETSVDWPSDESMSEAQR